MEHSEEVRRLHREAQELRKEAAHFIDRLKNLERKIALINAKEEAGSPINVSSEALEPVRPPVQTPPQEIRTKAMPPPLPKKIVEKPPDVVPQEPVSVKMEPVLEPQPSLLQNLKKKANVPEKGVGWEMALGTYWLPRIGMFVMAIGVVFFLTLAIQKLANHPLAPHFRICLGYIGCITLLGFGWKLEKKYGSYGRLLFSGGVALSYFVTFATHFIPISRIIESPVVTLYLLAFVVVFWGIFTQIRQSKSMAFAVTALGHFTIFWSSLYMDYPSRFLPLGIVFLGIGSAFFLLKNGWYYVAVLGIVGSYLNHIVWMFQVEIDPIWPTDFTLSMGVLSVYLITFALAELFSPENLRRKSIPVWFRTAYVTLNTASFFTIGTIVMMNFDITRSNHHIFHFCYTPALLVIALAYLHLRRRDPLFNVYMTKAVAVFTLGLAVYYSGSGLTAWLAVETAVLVVSARRSGLLVTRILAFIIAGLTLFDGIYTVFDTRHLAYSADGYFALLIQAVIITAAFLLTSQIYQRTNWTIRSPKTIPFLSGMGTTLLWKLDLIGEPPERSKNITKPLDGLMFPYVYALTGTVLFYMFTTDLVTKGDFTIVYTAMALAMVVAAAILKSKPFGFISVIAVAISLFPGTYEISILGIMSVSKAIYSIIALFVVALACEQKYIGQREGLFFHQTKQTPYFLYASVAWLLGLLIVQECTVEYAILALMVSAIACAVLVWNLHPRALACVSVALLLWAHLRWHQGGFDSLSMWWRSITLLLVALSLAGERYYAKIKDYTALPWLGLVPLCAAWFLLHDYTESEFGRNWQPLCYCLIGFGFLAYGLVFRIKTSVVVATLGTLIASFILITRTASSRFITVHGIIAGFTIAIAYWVVCERLYSKSEHNFSLGKRLSPTGVLVAIITVLLVTMLYRIPYLSDYYLTIGWTIAALILFGTSLVLRQKLYRYGGLAIFVLAIGRVFLVDTRELSALPRIAAFLVLGVVLLGVGYGYLKAMERLGLYDKKNAPS